MCVKYFAAILCLFLRWQAGDGFSHSSGAAWMVVELYCFCGSFLNLDFLVSYVGLIVSRDLFLTVRTSKHSPVSSCATCMQ